MAAKWETVSEDEAKQHKLYGVKGWLLVFGIGMGLSFFTGLGSVNIEAFNAGLTLGQFLSHDHPAVSFVKASLVYDAFIAISVICMMIAKASFFRITSFVLMLSILPMLVILAAATGFSGAGSGIGKVFIQWVLSCAVWGTYLFRSKRVRVTFEHKVKLDSDTPAAATPPVQRKPVIPSPIASTPRASNTRASAPIVQATPVAPAHVNNSAEMLPEEQLWATAIAEFEGSSRRPGLWAKCYAEAQGDEVKAKVAYLNARVDELKVEDEQRVLDVFHACEVAAEEERLAGLAAEQRVYELQPKGICPNCGTVCPLTSKSCPQCKASFEQDSRWSLKPIPQTDAQIFLHRAEASK